MNSTRTGFRFILVITVLRHDFDNKSRWIIDFNTSLQAYRTTVNTRCHAHLNRNGSGAPSERVCTAAVLTAVVFAKAQSKPSCWQWSHRCLSIIPSFSVTSANIAIAISDISLKTRFFGLHFRRRKSWCIFDHFYVISPDTYRIPSKKGKVTAITPFKVIHGHRFWYQSKAHMRLPISD